jgi:hypothetical protein
VDLGTEKAPGTKLAKSNFQLPTSNFLFLKTEGHVFSNPLYVFFMSPKLNRRGSPKRRSNLNDKTRRICGKRRCAALTDSA